jgi:predicted transcriptional regulator
MAKVWVQVWTAKVAGSVEVEETDLQKVQGLESLQKLIPMLVKVSEHSGWEMVPNWGKQLVSAEEKVEVLEPRDLEMVQESESLSRLEMAKAKARELNQ